MGGIGSLLGPNGFPPILEGKSGPAPFFVPSLPVLGAVSLHAEIPSPPLGNGFGIFQPRVVPTPPMGFIRELGGGESFPRNSQPFSSPEPLPEPKNLCQNRPPVWRSMGNPRASLQWFSPRRRRVRSKSRGVMVPIRVPKVSYLFLVVL